MVDWDRTGSGASGVSALDEEVLDDAVEEGAVVVALEAELHEVARRLGGLLGPQLDVERASRRLHHHLALRRGLKHVHRRHPACLAAVASGRRRPTPRRSTSRAWSPSGRAVGLLLLWVGPKSRSGSSGSWLGWTGLGQASRFLVGEAGCDGLEKL